MYDTDRKAANSLILINILSTLDNQSLKSSSLHLHAIKLYLFPKAPVKLNSALELAWLISSGQSIKRDGIQSGIFILLLGNYFNGMGIQIKIHISLP
ncbi:hypothetical protein EYC84_000572 [Monilinia fructicola]|uniref:Uncharacterized protein n=1 Tax=Monilinia fructicola TaxID=38448 RepID=A0A5M9JT48_MONFR|nr:hypothetical protein EYC84_000572 [Monilinia fructicola]